MAHALSSLIDRLATPVSRRTGITATLLAIAAGLAGTAETDAKKKKKKKKKKEPVALGERCAQVSDCANSQAWQCAPYANNKFSSSPTAKFCLLHNGDPCDQNSACPYGNCLNGQCASASTVGNTNAQFMTLAAAVASTFAGGEICILPGVYEDVSATIDKTLTITRCGSSGSVELKSPSNGRVLTLQLANAGDLVTIRGGTADTFTFTGTVANDGDRVDDGGIVHLSQSGSGGAAAGSLLLEKVTIKNGRARFTGGGLYANTTGAVTMTDVLVTTCYSQKGGGIAMVSGDLTLNGETWVKSCIGYQQGAGILLQGATTLSMEDMARIGGDVDNAGINCLQRGGNWAPNPGVGGGVYASSGVTLSMSDDAVIVCNLATSSGGIHVEDGATLQGNASCESGKVTGNTADNIQGAVTPTC